MPEIAQTADHALRILEELGQGEPLSLAQLAERLRLSKTATHRLLVTLGARGFVLRQGGQYHPGATLVRLAAALRPDLRAASADVMRTLAAATGETVVLHILDDLEAVVIDQAVASRHLVRVSHQIGSRHSLSLGASGRVILAFAGSSVRRRVLADHSDPASVEGSLASIATAGYAQSHDELQEGVQGIAAPVFDHHGVVASLAVLVPVARAEGAGDHVPRLLKAARGISGSLGASKGSGYTQPRT